MEKRTIIAFVLSFLVLIMWSFLFQPAQKQGPVEVKEEEKTQSAPTPSPRQTESEAKEKEATPEVREAPPAPAPLPVAEKEKDIIIDTPLYRAVFSNAGPTIRSFKLKNYRLTTAPDSPLVELVHLAQPVEGLVEMGFKNPSGNDLHRMVFQTEQDSLTLSPESSSKDLTFRTVTPAGLSMEQTFRFHPDKYPIEVTLSLQNNSTEKVNGNLAACLKNLPPEKDRGYYTFLGLALLREGKLEELPPKKLDKEKTFSGHIEWMAYEDGHFMTAVIPEDQAGGKVTGLVLPSGVVRGNYDSPPVSLGPQETSSSRFKLYMGPRDLTILKSVEKNLDQAISFGWTDVIAKPLLYALRFFHKFVGNWGLAIIILTVLIKILFWPLTHKSYKSMKEMQKLQPYMAKLREKYKDNKEQLNKELMGLYKTYKVNPMGGCLPMIIQIPVFFALFRILGNSIELRHAPFFLWINDLSAPDRLFNFPFKIPFMSPPYGIPVLTLLMGASMFIQQKMTPTPGDPTQAKIMMFLPLIFTFMFINFPSGLVLYWLINNLLSIGQQYRIIKSPA